MIKQVLIVLALAGLVTFLGSSQTAYSQSLEKGTLESVGLNKEKIGKIDTAMEGHVKSGKMVGASALIFKDGKEVYYKNWGKADREKDVDMKRDTIVRIYSMSKPITSVAIMQLVEKGKIDLDKPVAEYLPEFKDVKVLEKGKSDSDMEWVEVKPKRVMTTRDLLRHTSGLTYGFFGNTEVDKRYRKAGVLADRTIEAMVKKVAKLPLLNHPGTQFHYSVSTDVLGRLVEVASGERFDKYLKANIFDPLQMKDTSFVVPKAKRDRFAKMYSPDGDGLKQASSFRSMSFLNEKNLMFSGGGGLCSTVDDYLSFSRMLLNKGELHGKRLLKADTIDQMFKNQLDTVEKSSSMFKFGLGFSISPQGDRGWGGAAGTRFWVNPDKKMIIVFMVQINPYNAKFGEEVKRLTYRAMEK